MIVGYLSAEIYIKSHSESTKYPATIKHKHIIHFFFILKVSIPSDSVDTINYDEKYFLKNK